MKFPYAKITLRQVFTVTFATGASLIILTTEALSQTNTCYSTRDEATPTYEKCKVKFANGSIFSIKTLSNGYTFRIGENGWIPVSGKNCIRNIESAAAICLAN